MIRRESVQQIIKNGNLRNRDPNRNLFELVAAFLHLATRIALARLLRLTVRRLINTAIDKTGNVSPLQDAAQGRRKPKRQQHYCDS